MRCYREADPRTFAEQVLGWLSQDPIGNNTVSTVVSARVAGDHPAEPDACWLQARDGTDLAGVAVLTPPHGLLLSTMTTPVAEAVADYLVDAVIRPPTVDGPTGPTTALRDRYCHGAGATATPGRASRIYRLDTVDSPVGVPGQPRGATWADRDLLVGWLRQFGLEVGGAPDPDPTVPIDRRLRQPQAGLLRVWTVGGVVTSMAMLHPPVAGVSRVWGVYTPPEQRGHGYGAAGVAATSRYALDSGSSACMLYTDLANPTSNKIYQQVGYRPVVDTQAWVLHPAVAVS